MSRRIQQLESSLQRSIGHVLTEELSDPRLRGLISVTAVEVSPDLADAVVKVSVLPADHEELAIAGLDSASARIRWILSGRLRVRRMPRLHFRIDRSLKRQAEVLSAIRDARATDDDGQGPEAADDAGRVEPPDASTESGQEDGSP